MSNEEYNCLKNIHHNTRKNIVMQLGWGCDICGARVDNVVWDFHHIVPTSWGGEDNDNNLAYICPNCHRAIHSSLEETERASKTLVPISVRMQESGVHWHQFYHKTRNKD